MQVEIVRSHDYREIWRSSERREMWAPLFQMLARLDLGQTLAFRFADLNESARARQAVWEHTKKPRSPIYGMSFQSLAFYSSEAWISDYERFFKRIR